MATDQWLSGCTGILLELPGGLELLMTVASLFTDLAGNIPFLRDNQMSKSRFTTIYNFNVLSLNSTLRKMFLLPG